MIKHIYMIIFFFFCIFYISIYLPGRLNELIVLLNLDERLFNK